MDRKIALITGGTRGIGLAIAREIQDDYHLIIGGSSEKAHNIAAQFPSAQGFVADLADTEGIGAAVAELGLERLDVLVHSAGVVAHDPVTETTHLNSGNTLSTSIFLPLRSSLGSSSERCKRRTAL